MPQPTPEAPGDRCGVAEDAFSLAQSDNASANLVGINFRMDQSAFRRESAPADTFAFSAGDSHIDRFRRFSSHSCA